MGIELFLLALACGGAGLLIGSAARGRPAAGFWFGLLLGPLGWLLVLLGGDERKKCSACQGAVPETASRCRHCGFEHPDGRPVYLRRIKSILAEPEPRKPPKPGEPERPYGSILR